MRHSASRSEICAVDFHLGNSASMFFVTGNHQSPGDLPLKVMQSGKHIHVMTSSCLKIRIVISKHYLYCRWVIMTRWSKVLSIHQKKFVFHLHSIHESVSGRFSILLNRDHQNYTGSMLTRLACMYLQFDILIAIYWFHTFLTEAECTVVLKNPWMFDTSSDIGLYFDCEVLIFPNIWCSDPYSCMTSC